MAENRLPEPLLGRRKVRQYANGVIQRARRVRTPQLEFPFAPPPIPQGVEPLAANDGLGGDYDASWARRPGAQIARSAIVETLLRPTIAAVARPDRIGYERLATLSPKQNAIFVANHHSHLDTSLLLTSIPHAWRRRLTVAAASELFFQNRTRATISALAIGAFPLDRTKTGRSAADQAADIIDEGNCLLIFPEGGRSPDGWGQPFKGGAAYLALRCNVPVVPVYLAGTGRVWRKGQSLPTPARTTVIFGDPIWAVEGDKTRRLNARIEAAVASLGDELATDWWQARKRFHADGPPTLEGPDASSWRRAWALGARSARDHRTPRWPR